MSDDAHYLINIGNATQLVAGHLNNIDKRLTRVANQALVSNAIAYLVSGQASGEECTALRAVIRKGLSLPDPEEA